MAPFSRTADPSSSKMGRKRKRIEQAIRSEIGDKTPEAAATGPKDQVRKVNVTSAILTGGEGVEHTPNDSIARYGCGSPLIYGHWLCLYGFLGLFKLRRSLSPNPSGSFSPPVIRDRARLTANSQSLSRLGNLEGWVLTIFNPCALYFCFRIIVSNSLSANLKSPS